MSFPLMDITDKTRGNRITFAFHLLENVAPKLLDQTIIISSRVARAFVYYRFLCKVRKCPDVTKDPRRWGEKELFRIAEAVVGYAIDILSRELRLGKPHEPSGQDINV